MIFTSNDKTISTTTFSETKSVVSDYSPEKMQETLLGILECSPDGFYIMDSIRDEKGEITDYIFKLLNPTVQHYINMKAEDVVGRNFLTVFPHNRTTGIFDSMVRVTNSGRHEVFENFSERLSIWVKITVVKLGDGVMLSFTDIDDMKKAQDSLREESYLLDKITNAAPAATYIYDIEKKKVVYGGAKFCETFGFTKPESGLKEILVDMPVHAEDSIWRDALLKESEWASDDELIESEFRVRDANGRLRWVYCRELPFRRNDEGKVVRLIGTLLDITERVRDAQRLELAEAELRQANESLAMRVEVQKKQLIEAEERFALLIESTDDIIWDWNTETDEIWIADSIRTNLGYKIRPTAREFRFDLIHPDDRPNVFASLEDLKHGLTGKWVSEYRIRKADGSYAIVYDRAFCISAESSKFGPNRIIGSMVDVTAHRGMEQELKRSQAVLDEAQRISKLGSWEYDLESGAIYWSAEMYRIHGLSSEPGPPTYSDMAALFPESEMLNVHMENAVTRGIPYRFDAELVTPKKLKKYIQMIGRPVMNEKGRCLRLFGTTQDITERKIAEHALRESEKRYRKLTGELEAKVLERTGMLSRLNDELNRSNKELEQFAYVAGHDLQEPLRKIRSFGDRLNLKYKSTIPEEGQNYIERMQNSAGRMSRLIDDLLTFSRMRTDGQEYVETDLNDIVTGVLEDLEVAIEHKHAQITVEPLPTALRVIPMHITRMFQNLVSNALKFSKDDAAPEIKISCKTIPASACPDAKPGDGNFYKIDVQDNGIGFDQSYEDRIFVIFQRLHGKNNYEGTGIGLAVCKKAVMNHNGHIKVKSEPGAGSTFSIYLPVNGNY
ncbi:MAG: PAS domain-containing protein [Bacteroidota bacterium]